MELVVDWNAVCLVCLQEGEMRSIFENDDKDLTIRDKIIRCSDIEIQKGMNLPEQICSNCYEDLKIAYKFRTNCESSNVILKSFLNVNFNDVKLQNQNAQTFKCKQSGIVNVRRIKVAPKFEIKEENILSENVETEYISDTNDNDCVELDDNADTILETYANYENDDDCDDCDDNNYDNDQEAHEIMNENQQEENLEKEKIIRTDNSTNYTLIKKVKEENDDKDIGVVFKKVFGESEDEMESVQQNDEQLQENEYKTFLTDIENNSNTEQKPRKRGRPRFNVIRANLEVTPANVSQMVPKLTTVAYVKKKKNGEKPLKMCEICGNGYKYQHALDSHMRRHRNEKPFACEFCDRAFVANVELRRHMRVHTGQKPYSCRYCPRSFSDFGSRIKHERTHTGERPYECSTCGKAFAYAHVLSVHVLTHTGEKKFKCEICGKGFTKKSYLQSHTNQHFGLKKEPTIHEIQILTGENDTNEEILGNEQYELGEPIEHKVEEYVGNEVD